MNLSLYDFFKTRSALKETLTGEFSREEVLERIDDYVEATKWLLFIPLFPATFGIPIALINSAGLIYKNPNSGFIFWPTILICSGLSYLLLKPIGKRHKQKLIKKYLGD